MNTPADSGLSRRVPGAHGLTLHLREWPGPGIPLVLLHGFLLDSRAWDFVLPRFTARRRVLALDARGHGDSQSDPRYRYHHAALGMDLRAVLEHLGLPPVDLVAHSTSGHAAIGFAARAPERLRRLVLVEAGPELPSGGRGGARSSDEPTDPIYERAEDYARVLARRHPRARPEILAHIAHHGLRARPGGGLEPKLDPSFTRPRSAADPEHRRRFDRRSWAAEGEKQLWADLARIRCATLVVRGACSTRLGRHTVERMVSEVLRSGSSSEIPDAGHNVMLDQPEALADALAEFLGC